MAEEVIDNYIDRAGVKSDTDFMVAALQQVYAEFKKLESVKIDLKGVNGLSGIQPAMKAGEDAANKMVAATARLKTGLSGLSVEVNKAAAAIQQENLTLGQAVEIRKKLENSIKSLKKQEEDNLRLLKAGALSQDQYAKTLQVTSVKIEQYKNRLKDVNKEIVLQTRTEKQVAAERAKNARIEADANNKQVAILQKSIANIQKQSGAYAQLSREYNEVSLSAKNFNLTLGANNPLTIAATRRAGELATQLKTVDATVGQNQRSVGDYSNAITKAAGGAFGAIRKLAYVLPGLGIAGIFGLIFDGLSNVISSLNIFSSKMSEAAKNQKNFAEVEKQAAESAGQEAGALKVLRAQIESTQVPMKNRLQAIKNLREIFPAYFADVSNENLLAGNAAAAYNLSANAILRKARANAAAGEIERLAREKLVIVQRSENDALKTNEEIKNAKTTTIGFIGGSVTVTAEQEKKNALIRFNQRKAADQAEIDALSAQQDNLLKFVIGGAEQTLEVEKVTTEKVKDTKVKSAKDLADELLKINFEIQSVTLKQIIDFNKEVLEGDSIHYQDRYEALLNYSLAKEDLINKAADLEIKTGTKTAKEIELIELKRRDELLRLRRETEFKKLELVKDVNAGLLKNEEELKDGLRKVADKIVKDYFDAEEAKTKKKKEEDKKKLQDEKEYNDQRKKLQQQLVSELTNFAFTALTSDIERRKNALQLELDQIEKNKAREIELAGGNADAIAVIEARTSVQKETIADSIKDAHSIFIN